MASGENVGDRTPLSAFLGRLLIVSVVAALLAALWFATRVFLLAFAGVLFAVFLDALTRGVRYVTGLWRGVSLAIVLVLLSTVIALCVWLISARVGDQMSQLSQQLPESWEQFQQRLEESSWGRWFRVHLPETPSVLGRTDLFSQFTDTLSSISAFFVGLALIVFVGVYLAADPELYCEGVVQLVPVSRRERVRAALRNTGRALRWWLLGQLVTMVIIGVTMGGGLWLIGVPLALSLGLLAFFLEIIPNIGPLLAAIPAFLLAWTQGLTEVFLVGIVYIIVHGLESYVLIPLIQQKTVRLAPALSIVVITLFGLLGGIIGMFVAAPLTIAAIVLIKMLYVRDYLGDYDGSLPGDA